MKSQLNGSLNYLRTTDDGGALFLMPVFVVVALLAYVYQGVASLHSQLQSRLPLDSAVGFALLFGLAVAALLAASFLAGLLARRAAGVYVTETIEKQLMAVYPKYGVYKELISGKIGGHHNMPSLRPILVKRPGACIWRFRRTNCRTA